MTNVRAAGPSEPSALDEPVRRFFDHALPTGVELDRVRLEMHGRIRVRRWMPFTATWEGDGRSFVWRASAAARLLRVVDQYRDGRGRMDVRLLGRVPLVHSVDEDTTRSAAGRAAIEGALWSPGSLKPGPRVTWRAESDGLIVGRWDVHPERPEVRLEIDASGAVRRASVMRWDNGEHGLHGYIPMGGEVLDEARFGDLVLPSHVRVGWWFGTPRWEPFFEARITAAYPSASLV
jgi:hypothetical protein